MKKTHLIKSLCIPILFSSISLSSLHAFEAENTLLKVLNDAGRYDVTTQSISNASNRKFITLYNKGDEARFKVSVKSSGFYYVKVRIRSGAPQYRGVEDPSNNRTIYLHNDAYSIKINNEAYAFNGDDNSVSALVNWIYWGTMESADKIYLNAGENYIDVKSNRDWLAVDSIALEKDEAESIETPIFEVENSFSILEDRGNNSAIHIGNMESASNQKYVSILDTGDKIGLQFNVSKNGTYTLRLRVRAGWITSDNYKVTLDNSNATLLIGQYDQASNSGEGQYIWSDIVYKNVSLTAGEHTLKILANKNWQLVDVLKVNLVDDNSDTADTTAPVITLKGNNPISVTLGQEYIDAGATAIDNVDGTLPVEIDNPVDSNTVGTYTVKYSAIDSAGNSSTLTRTVIVHLPSNNTNNTIHISGSSVVYHTLQEAVDNVKDGATISLENGIYPAGITINKNNLTIKNVEGADNVVISGEKSLINWQYDDSRELYYTSIPNSCSDVQMLFVNGVEKKASRYPNTGYFIVKDSPSKSKFSLENFNMTNDDIKDSIAHIRMNQWRLASRRVKSYEYNYINLVSEAISNANNITPQYKVFFTQVLSAIDSNNEWALNENKIYMKSDNIPENVTVACSEHGIYLDSEAKNITISGLNITKIKGNGITKKIDTRKNTNDNIVIKNNTISYTSGWGIQLRDFYKRYERFPANTIIQGNEVHHTQTGGISIFADNALIDNNYIHDIGASKLDDDVLSYGESNMLSGIYVNNSSGAKVSNNRIDKVGYNGISIANSWAGWMSNGGRIIENNYITNALLALNDGGCIYTYTGKDYDIENNREPEKDIIRNNIMENCIGSYAGTNDPETSQRAGEGIYLDNDSSYTDIYNNTVISATKSLFLNYAFEVNVDNNTFLSPDTVNIYLRKPEQDSESSANRNISNTKMLSKDKLTYAIIYYEDGQEYLTNSNHNIIRINSGTDLKIRQGYGTTANISLSQWQGYGYDKDSSIIKDNSKPIILINPSSNQKRFNHLEGCHKFDNSLLDSSSSTIEPYDSLVLFGCTNYTPDTYQNSK
jgi:hypothetical protein